MNQSDHLLALLEELRIPLNSPDSPIDWKDWYHFTLFHMNTGIRLLANVSLTGRPEYGQITISGLVTIPESSPAADLLGPGTFGCCVDHDWKAGMVQMHPMKITTSGFNCAIQGTNSYFSIENSRSCFTLEFSGRARAAPIPIPETLPFGSGFIGWGFIPGVDVSGSLRLGQWAASINNEWYCYHDHNYGRFRWGENVGWIWFVAHAIADEGEKYTFVLHRGNNRDHTITGSPYLFVYRNNNLIKMFVGESVDIFLTWGNEPILPKRLPGAMATLFTSQKFIIPEKFVIDAADDVDRTLLTMKVSSSMELILPDNQQRQYTLIEELNGEMTTQIDIKGITGETEGLFYAEYVH